VGKEDYQNVIAKPLKLKSKDSKVSKKKKKSKKSKKRANEAAIESMKPEISNQSDVRYSTLTKAERKHREVLEKQKLKRIMEKASKSHKERVEDFNRHLDSLSEHNDIPKVSWTK